MHGQVDLAFLRLGYPLAAKKCNEDLWPLRELSNGMICLENNHLQCQLVGLIGHHHTDPDL